MIGGRLDQGQEAFLLARVAAHVEAVEVEYGGQFLELDRRRVRLGAAQVLHYSGGGETGDQSKDHQHDQQLDQGEAVAAVLAAFS